MTISTFSTFVATRLFCSRFHALSILEISLLFPLSLFPLFVRRKLTCVNLTFFAKLSFPIIMTVSRKSINTTRVDVPVFWSFDAHLNRPAIHKIFYEFYLDCINSIDTAKVKIYEAHFDFYKGASFVFLDMPNFSTPSFIHNLFSEYSAFALQTAAKLGYFPSPSTRLDFDNELRVFEENSKPPL